MAKLAPTQVEQLQSIGAYLRQVRQEQGLAIDMLANQIFIRPALLKALEAGNDAELPEPVFIQGFIRRYAEALGLDGQTISQEFRVTPVNVLPTPELIERVDTNGAAKPEPRPAPQMVDRVDRTPSTAKIPSENRLSLPLVLSLVALAAVLGLGAWALFGRSNEPSRANNDNSAAETIPETPSTDAEVPEPAETAPDEPLETEDEEASAPLEAPVVVSANLSERAWLSVVADGENVYEGVAESGFEETWTAQTSLTFRTGNAGGVELSVNGDRAVVMGDSGVVRTLTVTPDSGVESVESP
ncbi:RodZ domain-containing protein [Leptolyngbya sp. CCNP1308]|uniref:helix-turn-helix domain-containing protein n=1 Tax=Leptolyngbya sp. CCNP1308 TaxID=3110255 RepID=UPI002B205D5B|nr:RodZ domain-containing protein [Leptolyngbya sp. CCNP1308]MEA5447390.1 RodZ domain-containing protein [Leptolyngbya sp. CCNP1308]